MDNDIYEFDNYYSDSCYRNETRSRYTYQKPITYPSQASRTRRCPHCGAEEGMSFGTGDCGCDFDPD